jgi:type VI secretion system protein
MRPGLFDILVGQFGDGPALGAVASEDQRQASIVANLQRLFNTRQGSVAHLPEYGLPDLTTIYQEAPDSIDRLRNALREAIEHYEPRLRQVHVDGEDTGEPGLRITFIVSGEIAPGRRVRLETTFVSQDRTRVRTL